MTMNRTDTYYRALLGYRKLVDEQRDCKLENKSVANSGTKADRIYFERKSCIIDRSWVDAIEKGLVFIEKAIKEDRQFIRSNGEVVPIEKVKNVSKSSVEHLARHSNLITRVHEGEDIIPDQLYTVEKLNDYAVYENRFLYMLLCYLRDFISTRYNKILEISNTYHGTMAMCKSAVTDKQTINYKVELEHTRRDDEYLIATNKEKAVIDRIDLLLKTVLAFLKTPLMEIVAKAPMLKPPVTKTNVLKMNNNFKGAMELYGFVTSYEGEGFEVTVEKTELSPFDEELALEIANTVTLSAFITYENALGLRKELLQSYNREEQRLREEEFQRGEERLEELRRQLKNNGITAEEYIVSLEDRVRLLDKRANELPRVQAKLETAQERLAAARAAMDEALAKEREARAALDTTQYKLDTQIKRYDDDMARVRQEHSNAISELHLRHEAELDRLRTEHESRMQMAEEAHRNELETVRAELEERLTAVREELEERLASLRGEVEETKSQLDTERREHTAELTRLNDDCERKLEMLRQLVASERERADSLAEAARVSDARLYALRFEIGEGFEEEGFVYEENFDELERTYRAFRKFYQEQWSKAKRHIRQDLLRAKKKGEEEQAQSELDETNAPDTDGEYTADIEVPTEEITEAPAEEITEAPVEETAEAPVEEPAEAPTEEITEAPAEEITEAPAEETAEVPAEEITEAPVEEITETPTEETAEVPTEEITEAPAEETAEAPAEEITEAPAEETAEAPTEEITEAPAEETAEVPAEETAEVPTEEITEAPVEEPVEEPAEAPVEEKNPAGLTDEQLEEIRENARKMAQGGEIYVGENTPNGSFALDSISEASYVGANESEEERATRTKGRKRKK